THFFNRTGLFHWTAINNLSFVNNKKLSRKYNEMNHGNPKGLTESAFHDKSTSLSRSERQYIQSLHQKKYRYHHNQFVLEGIKLVQEAILARYPIRKIYIGKTAQSKNWSQEFNSLVDPELVQIVSDSEIIAISSLKNPEGVIAIAPISSHEFSIKLPQLAPFIYLWEINDPGNLGTILRTARWFGIQNVLLSPNSVDPFSPKVVRGTMGALFNISIWQNVEFDDLKTYADNREILLVSADTSGPPVNSLHTDRWGLILGNESRGLPDSILNSSTQTIGIPRYGSGESLNLSVSAGIILNELCRQDRG
ncbi:RNA methyltransferase, partial [bacterium]|nr:RNA methyltransferase [bacterium]MBU1633531.1 RNA methyltransferase [bacterium]